MERRRNRLAGRRDGLCRAIIVEEVFANGLTRIVYGHGTHARWKVGMPDAWRATGRIENGVLAFRSPLSGRTRYAYRFDGDRLIGGPEDARGTLLARAVDVARLDCGRAERIRTPAPPAGTRGRLTADELLGRERPLDAPAHNDYFMPVGAVAPAKHHLRGVLTVSTGAMSRARRGCRGLPSPGPTFAVAFFTDGEHLVPAVRDIVQPAGRVILSPGRVWWEPGDRGMSRASFHFLLVNPADNASHNALATFLFDDAHVSALYVQIGQENSAAAKLDAWGPLPMAYEPGPVPDEAVLRAMFAEELRHRTPMHPWSALPSSPALADFDGDAAHDNDISTSGLVLDGVLYVRGCHTRQGPFPYCREMRHGVFSVTKSLGAAVALLRLAQKYGDGVLDEKLSDYLPSGLAHAGWNRVTFADALNMATGIGDEHPVREPNDAFADENRPKMTRWLRLPTAREKLQVALGYGKYPWARGEVVRYNTTQTFVLAYAMDMYLKRREGPDAHLWDMVRNEVYRPLGILDAPAMHTIERDGSRGVPLLGFGLYPTIDDVAKLTTMLQDGGRHDGVQLLSASKLAEALYHSVAIVGLPLGFPNRFGMALYHLSFWSMPYRTSTGCFFHIPYMSGYGGNLVALLPNGVSVFRFADGHDYDVDSMVVAGESLRPFSCTSGSNSVRGPMSSGPPPAVTSRPLAAEELRAALPDHTLTIGMQSLFLAPRGHLFGSLREDRDVGTWEITEDGRFCRTWNVWDNRRIRCYRVYHDGEMFELLSEERFLKLTATRTPGGATRTPR